MKKRPRTITATKIHKNGKKAVIKRIIKYVGANSHETKRIVLTGRL